jgi:hypothetical protein
MLEFYHTVRMLGNWKECVSSRSIDLKFSCIILDGLSRACNFWVFMNQESKSLRQDLNMSVVVYY